MTQPYETYKDSGVEWIGQIPNHWESIRMKFIGALYSGLSGKKGGDFKKEKSEFNQKYIPFTNIANNAVIDPNRLDTVEILENEKQNDVKKNDLFFLMSSENYEDIGKTAVLQKELENTYLNSFCKGFRLFEKDDVDANFLNYLLAGDIYRKILSIEAKGFTRINLQMGKIQNLPVILPVDKKEQTQIAHYLDHKTSLIDNFIAQKEQLIDKLKAQRQAIINEAVTKGLNPDAPLKDSGIEWLGKIPEHWEATSIKNILSIPITDGPHTTPEFLDDGVPFISAESIRNHKIDFNNKRGYISEEDYELYSKKYIPEINDIYMVKSGATTGNIAIVDTEAKFTIWSPLAVFRANPEKLFYEYLFFVLQSKFFKYQVELNWSYGTQQNIGMGVLSNLKIVFPKDILEQKNIVKQIKVSTIKSDASIESINDSIKKLKEYRQSIISEAVTGKIDVRDWEKNKI